MTRSKIELAIILSKLRGKDEDPEVLANELSLMKLCYEIQKVEETNQSATQEQTVTASASKDEETPKEPENLEHEWILRFPFPTQTEGFKQGLNPCLPNEIRSGLDNVVPIGSNAAACHLLHSNEKLAPLG